MMTNDLPAGTARSGTVGLVADDRSYVDWPAALAGAALAAAISLVMLSFGSALGLGITSPLPGEGVSFLWFAIAAGLWLLWVQVSSFMAGGYLAGRLRRRVGDATEDEVDMRDGSHGLLVWAVGTLVGAVMLMSGLIGAAQTAGQAVGAAAGTAITAAAEAAGEDGADGMAGYLTDTLFRADTAATSPEAQADRAEAGRILVMALAEGELAADDRAYLVNLVSRQTGLDPAATEARIAAVETRVVEAREAALEAVDEARRIGVMAAFLIAASLLVSAAAAYFAAGVGGRHRDDGTIIRGWRPAR
jgi:hypothetical protein